MSKLVLGLDLGPNSIGWALVDEDESKPPEDRLVGLGVRVFPEGVDAFDTSKEVSRNEDRRIARGMRRQIRRRAQRRRQLRDALIASGLWPAEEEAAVRLYALDPYELRSRGLREELSPHEFGRIVMHLTQRRGFLSNRKKDRGDSEVKGLLAEINENERERDEGDFATIGDWLHKKQTSQDHTQRQENDHVRRRHLARKQYEDEFEMLWKSQADFHPDLLTDHLKYGTRGKQSYPCKPTPRNSSDRALVEEFGLQGLLFFQRKMYWPKSVIGLCELEPKQKRCPRADRRYQRFRVLQEVNNLKYIDPDTHGEHRLSCEQRQLVLGKLSQTNEMTFDQIRKTLGFLESVKFNLEAGKRTKLKGATIDALFAAGKVVGKSWYKRDEAQRSEIIAVLLDNERDDDQIVQRAIADWEMTSAQAQALVDVDLPAGYGDLSLVALQKLIPHMEAGLLYMADDETNSAMHAAGYLRRDQLKRRLFDELPDPRRTANCPIGDIPNPVVKRTLTEVRRVVNAIIREYGKPDAVHVEMARDVQQGKKKRTEYTKRMRENESRREKATERLRELGVRVKRDNILRYSLWEQQGGICIYSDTFITPERLFSEAGGVEVDHILPRSRTLDDSQANKVICLRESNANKRDRTPYEWLAASDEERYEQLCQRAGKLMRSGKFPYSKYRRFVQKELELDKFIARQLNDTGYITKATAEYLRCLFDKSHDVLGLKGQLTSELRWHWGLETLLSELADSPAWHEQSKLRDGKKNRADHRHHAIDALVVALTNRSRLQSLSRIVKTGGARNHGEILEDPWPNFRDAIKHAVAEVRVSHRVERKVRGALHEETLYGQTENEGEWVVRKPVESLSANEIEKIRDDTIRAIIVKRLEDHGVRFGRGKKPDPKKLKEALADLKMPSGVPIKKVRILKQEKTIQPIRLDKPGRAFVKPGSTHHLCIFEWEEKGKSKRDAVFVTMLEATNCIKERNRRLAAERKRLRAERISGPEFKQSLRQAASRISKELPVIQRDAAKIAPGLRGAIPDNARFVMSLSRGECVLMDVPGATGLLLSLKTAISTNRRLIFALQTDSRKSSDYKKIAVSPRDFCVLRKVAVDPLGRIRWAND